MKKVMMLLGVLFLLAAPGMAQNKQSIEKALVNSISPFGTTQNSLSIAKTVEKRLLEQKLSQTNVTGKELAWEDVKAAILSGDRDKIIGQIIPAFHYLDPEQKNRIREQVVAIAKMRNQNPGSENWRKTLNDFRGGKLPKISLLHDCNSIYSVAVIPARDRFKLSVCCTGTTQSVTQGKLLDIPFGVRYMFGTKIWNDKDDDSPNHTDYEPFSNVREANDMMTICTLEAHKRGGYFLYAKDFSWADAYKLHNQLIDKSLESSDWFFIRLLGHIRYSY